MYILVEYSRSDAGKYAEASCVCRLNHVYPYRAYHGIVAACFSSPGYLAFFWGVAEDFSPMVMAVHPYAYFALVAEGAYTLFDPVSMAEDSVLQLVRKADLLAAEALLCYSCDRDHVQRSSPLHHLFHCNTG